MEKQFVYVSGTESEPPARIEKTLNYINVKLNKNQIDAHLF
jgi:hypothetical protein